MKSIQEIVLKFVFVTFILLEDKILIVTTYYRKQNYNQFQITQI